MHKHLDSLPFLQADADSKKAVSERSRIQKDLEQVNKASKVLEDKQAELLVCHFFHPSFPFDSVHILPVSAESEPKADCAYQGPGEDLAVLQGWL